MRYAIIAVFLLSLLLAGCSSAANTTKQDQAIRDLQATIAALTAITPSPTASPTPLPTPAPTPESFVLLGTISTVKGCDEVRIFTGTNVTVTNETGAIIGATVTMGQHDERINSGGIMLTTCNVSFSTMVPRAQFYHVKIGTHDGPSYTFDQMQQMGWMIALYL